jgi:DNA-binding CsgD family transcriptional regulator
MNARASRNGSATASDRLALLTPRERELLATVSTGASSAEMATQLGIAVPTIKRHLANLYRKLGCSNRVQLSNLYHLGDPRGRPRIDR